MPTCCGAFRSTLQSSFFVNHGQRLVETGHFFTMFFKFLNDYQRSISATCILVLGIIQIAVDSWTLHKIQQHEELILFLTGTSIPGSAMRDMTYEQALSYFSKMKRFLSPDFFEVLDYLKMATILGLVAGILQSFTSTVSVVWKGRSVDITWLVLNMIVSILLSIAVSYIAIHMIRDVPYHQVLLTVTSVNLFVLLHMWALNFVALLYSSCFGGDKATSGSNEDIQDESRRPSNSDSDIGQNVNTQHVVNPTVTRTRTR